MGRLFARAVPARKPPHQGRWPRVSKAGRVLPVYPNNNVPRAHDGARGTSHFPLYKTLQSVDKCVVDGGNCLVGVGLVDDDADLDLTGGDHLDVDVLVE